jgi:tryptophan halogenase
MINSTDFQHTPIKRIAILGGGMTGWTVAAALANGLRGIGIDIVLIDNAQQTETDLHCEATMPACVAFHQWLGVTEKELVARTGASFLLATQFNAWADQQQQYFMPFGDHGFMLNRIEFPQYVIGRYLQGKPVNYDDYSLAAVAAKAGRFCHPSAQDTSLFSTLSYGLTLNTFAYSNYLRERAVQSGVAHVIAEASTLKLNSDGYIESITLNHIHGALANTSVASQWIGSDRLVAADFYIDCTGAQGNVIGKALHVEWQSLSGQLPVTHVINHVQPISQAQSIPSRRELLTGAAGWIQNLSSQTHTEQQYFYHSSFTSAEQARIAIGAAESAQAKPICIGRREKFWHKNCVAIGESAGNLDVQGAGKLHLVQSAILRFISLFPARMAADFNAAEYNRLTNLEYDHIEDFHSLHYQLAATQDTAYWQQLARVTLSDRLLHKLDLFKKRGLVAFYEGETFSSGVWTSLLLGNGFWPQRYDPLIHSTDAQWIELQLEKMEKMMRSAAEAMPTQSEYLYKQKFTAEIDIRSAANSN